MGGVEESTLRLNSAQFQLKLPAGAELGNIKLVPNSSNFATANAHEKTRNIQIRDGYKLIIWLLVDPFPAKWEK